MDTITTTGVEDRFVDFEGLRLRYIEQGDGPAVILLHGASLGSSADVFRRTLAPLAEAGFRAIAFDQPGFGLSDTPADHGLGLRQRSIVGLMDALGLEKAALVGHSQAGNFAFALALEQPGRVSHVIVLGTGSLLPPLPDAAPKAQARAPAEGREGTPSEPAIEDTRRLMEANLFHRELITEAELRLRHGNSTGKNFEAFVARGKAREAGAKGGMPLWQRLDDAPVPLLMVYGLQDRADAGARAALLKRQKPGLDLHIVDGCKHLVPWDAAEEWTRLAVAFMRR